MLVHFIAATSLNIRPIPRCTFWICLTYENKIRTKYILHPFHTPWEHWSSLFWSIFVYVKIRVILTYQTIFCIYFYMYITVQKMQHKRIITPRRSIKWLRQRWIDFKVDKWYCVHVTCNIYGEIIQLENIILNQMYLFYLYCVIKREYNSHFEDRYYCLLSSDLTIMTMYGFFS